jgi:phage/plasmid-like protein (TIGR03299 family)
VSDEYEVVENRDAFRFLDALIGSDMHFETAGSLWGGRRVWCLARLPEYVELGGDLSATYIYVANSHDGSMAVTAAVTPIRIVCANTLGAPLRQAEHGVNVQHTFRFRHTGNLQAKFSETRQVLGMTINYQAQFKTLADQLAREPIGPDRLERTVLRHLWTIDEDTGKRARENRERTIESVLAIFAGRGGVGDTTGNSPASKWCAWNAIAAAPRPTGSASRRPARYSNTGHGRPTKSLHLGGCCDHRANPRTATARRRWSDSYAFLMPTSDCVGDAGFDGSEVVLLVVREGAG